MPPARCALLTDHDQQRPHSRQPRNAGADEPHGEFAPRLSAERSSRASPDDHRAISARRSQATMTVPGPEAIAAADDPLAPMAERLFQPLGVEGVYARTDRYESGGDWTTSLGASDLVLSPAACYPLYPLVAARGRIPSGGLLFDVAADCFRREPSRSLDRLQSFRMREFVRIGRPEEITAFRESWITRARELAEQLALPYSIEVANDPFFGRVGQIMAVSQIQQALKFELLIPYHAKAKPTACMSFNYHREHFGQVWGLQDSRGELVHTCCVAFGMDRLAVALFANHGLDVTRWPASTRRALDL